MLSLSVEIHCTMASWGGDTRFIERPAYRIYCNDDLIIERTWVWSNSEYITEQLFLKEANNYTITLEPLLHELNQANLEMINLRTEHHYQLLEQSTQQIKVAVN